MNAYHSRAAQLIKNIESCNVSSAISKSQEDKSKICDTIIVE